jgi:hypothetical protein
MEIEELKNTAARIMADSVDELKRTGSVNASFLLIRRDGAIEIMVLLGDAISDPALKATVSSKIRGRAQNGELQAVLFVSDIFASSGMTEGQAETIRALRLNVEQAAALGLIQKREAVMVFIDSPIHRQIAHTFYRRVGGRQIEIEEATSMEEGPADRFTGRMIDFFAHPVQEGRPT